MNSEVLKQFHLLDCSPKSQAVFKWTMKGCQNPPKHTPAAHRPEADSGLCPDRAQKVEDEEQAAKESKVVKCLEKISKSMSALNLEGKSMKEKRQSNICVN